MKEELFDEFLESIKQAGKIREGELKASQRIVITDSDVAETRKSYNLNKQEFSSRFWIGAGKFHNWVQGEERHLY